MNKVTADNKFPFELQYQLRQFREVQSDYFDENGKAYTMTGFGSPMCEQMLSLINNLEAHQSSVSDEEDFEPSKEQDSEPVASHTSTSGNSIERGKVKELLRWVDDNATQVDDNYWTSHKFGKNKTTDELIDCFSLIQQYEKAIKQLSHYEPTGVMKLIEPWREEVERLELLLNIDKNPERSVATDDDSSNADDNQNPH